MKGHQGRRDFLRLAGLSAGSAALAPVLGGLPRGVPAQSEKQNVLIVVFDAWSAHDVSLYGYGRQTTPNIERLAERAVVYHRHTSGANFTTGGTASLLTGVYPWTHRALRMYKSVVETMTQRSIFHAFEGYHTLAYSHNPLVNVLFDQFQPALDEYIPLDKMLLTSDGIVQQLFHTDDDISSLGWVRAAKKEQNGGYAYSLMLSRFYEGLKQRQTAYVEQFFPRGLPYIKGDNFFVLEQAVDALGAQIGRAPQPFLGYLHFIPPHFPYRTHLEFMDRFRNDGQQGSAKPLDAFGLEKNSHGKLARLRTEYDEYILYIDREFGRFFEALETAGILNNTWLVLTSDHGEMFERGIAGHNTYVLYQPVVHVPLLIFEPGRSSRLDIVTPTSAVDVLPTMLQVTGNRAANWTEGIVMPPFGDAEAAEARSLFIVEARDNDPLKPLTKSTLAMVRGSHKLTWFQGYEQLADAERLELYELDADAEELSNVRAGEETLADGMLKELRARLAEADRPYT